MKKIKTSIIISALLLITLSVLSVVFLIWGISIENYEYCFVGFMVLLSSVAQFYSFASIINCGVYIKEEFKKLNHLKKQL